MKNIDLVVKERETALRLLQTGHEKPVPGEWRNDFLGRTYWYRKEKFSFIYLKFSYGISIDKSRRYF